MGVARLLTKIRSGWPQATANHGDVGSSAQLCRTVPRPDPRARLSIFRRYCAALLAVVIAHAHAQDAGVGLKLERRFTPDPDLTLEDQESAPVYLRADQLEGNAEQELEATGAVELRQRGMRLFTDQLHYSVPDNAVSASGNVRFEKEGDIIEGSGFSYDLDTDVGSLDQPRFRLIKRMQRKRPARGSARLVEFKGENRERLYDSLYTTCPPGQDDWFLRVKDLELDRVAEVGVARNATVLFMDFPILYLPWASFPLSDKRKSGFLTPTFGTSGSSGFEVGVPYYWNIAPNRDATFTPRILSKRGLLLLNEYRYLYPRLYGELHADVLPNDRQAGRDRYFLAWRHVQNLTRGWSGSLNLQKASDDDYFRDLSTRVLDTSTVNLPREATLSYSARMYSVSARLLSYQHLQDPLEPSEPPYQLAPQLSFATGRNVYGADANLISEWTDFHHPRFVTAQRFIVYPSASYGLSRSYGYTTAKLGFHHTQYHFTDDFTATDAITRNLPIFSVDNMLLLDRNFTYQGTRFRQTLEPRLFYVRIPFEDQSQIPNFSTSLADFGFTQIFTENQFIGGDRINDANQITAGVSTRFIASETGIERLRAGVAQRYYFTPPRVTLSGPNTPQERRSSDLLAGFTGRVSQAWSVDGFWHYNPQDNRSERVSVGTRYLPAPGKVLNLSYRFATLQSTPPDGVPDQIDISGQWPLSRRWYGLARVNYSLLDRKLLEGLIGVEYNAGCWQLRMVAHRFITAEQQVSSSFFVQLELNGLSRLGVNPLEVLRENIPGYTKSEQIGP